MSKAVSNKPDFGWLNQPALASQLVLTSWVSQLRKKCEKGRMNQSELPNGPIPLSILPDSAEIGPRGELQIGGMSVDDLVTEYGTPLFIYDEDHLRSRCREALTALGEGTAYAGKAFLCVAMARLVAEEGLHLDVASEG